MGKKLSREESEELDRLVLSAPLSVCPEDGEVTGIAADGVVVSIGNFVYGKRALLSYLRSHPSPKDW